MTSHKGGYLGRGGWIGWPTTLLLEKQKNKEIEKDCECFNRKGKHPVQVPHCNFYFVALPEFPSVTVFN